MSNLTECMNTRVGPATAGDMDRVVSNLRQRCLHTALYRRFLALYLPSKESAAIIFDAECVTHVQLTINPHIEYSGAIFH
jgi:hypothetical protein